MTYTNWFQHSSNIYKVRFNIYILWYLRRIRNNLVYLFAILKILSSLDPDYVSWPEFYILNDRYRSKNIGFQFQITNITRHRSTSVKFQLRLTIIAHPWGKSIKFHFQITSITRYRRTNVSFQFKIRYITRHRSTNIRIQLKIINIARHRGTSIEFKIPSITRQVQKLSRLHLT